MTKQDVTKPLSRNLNFSLLWLAQIFSGLADVLYEVTVMVTIFERTGSALLTAGVTVARTLPPFLLSPFAGVMVDRYPRRTVMIVMTIFKTAVVALLLTIAGGEALNVFGIYLVTAGLATAATFFTPARQALIPSIVPTNQLVTANSYIMAAVPATFALGFVGGGILVGRSSLTVVVGLMLVLLVLATALIVPIRPNAPHASKETTPNEPILQSIRTGVAYIRRHAIARPLVVMEFIEHVPHGIWTSAMLLVFVQTALKGGSAEWGQQNAAFFVAMFVGSVIGAQASQFIARQPGKIIIVNAIFSCLLTMAYSQSVSNPIAVVLAFGFGIPMALRDVAQDSLLQTRVDEGVLGRVYAFREMGRSIIFMVSGLFFAWLASYVDVRTIYLIGGLLYAGTALYAASSRDLRQSRIEEKTVASPTNPF